MTLIKSELLSTNVIVKLNCQNCQSHKVQTFAYLLIDEVDVVVKKLKSEKS